MAIVHLKGDVKATTVMPAVDEAKIVLGKRLIHACHYNQLDKVKELIAKGADPNFRNMWGETPAYAAAGSGGTEVLEYLASQNVHFDVTTAGKQTLLHNAVATGDVKIATYVASKHAAWPAQAYDGATVLHVAVRSGHYRMVRWLTSKKDKGLLEKVDFSGWNALHAAVAPYRLSRRFDILDALITAGVPLNEETYRNDTVVHLAARRGNPLMVSFLLENGAKIGCTRCETGATTCSHVEKKMGQFMRQIKAQVKKRDEDEGRAKPGFFSSLFGKKASRAELGSPPTSPSRNSFSTSAAPASPTTPGSSSAMPIASPNALAPPPVSGSGGAAGSAPTALAMPGTSPSGEEKKDKKEKKPKVRTRSSSVGERPDVEDKIPQPAAAAEGEKKEKREKKEKKKDKGAEGQPTK